MFSRAIVGRSATAARQLASRARRRVRRGTAAVPDQDLARQRQVVDAFLAASREGDFEALLAVLDEGVVLRADYGAAGASRLIRGARAVAGGALTFSRFAPFARPALVNGAAGLVTVREGRPLSVMGFTVVRGKIAEIDVLADPERLQRLNLAKRFQVSRSTSSRGFRLCAGPGLEEGGGWGGVRCR
jgi:RNA polymerase sigma-70 factor (ECF subfamily)